MFHNSGKRSSKYVDEEMNRICLHCGYPYGNHIGKLCPSAPITNEEIYLTTFCQE